VAASLLAGKSIDLDDGGAFGADFVFADDVADAFLILEGLARPGIWNVGSGRRTTMLQIGEALLKLTGADPSLMRIHPRSSSGRTGYPAINISKIRSLGFAPRDIGAGLRAIVAELAEGSDLLRSQLAR
jgi:UDP-glucose 4-epimerase